MKKSPNAEDFPERLQLAMKNAGISQADLARKMGTAWSTVARWLAGSSPRAKTLNELAAVLGVASRWIRTGEGEMLPPLKERLAAEPDWMKRAEMLHSEPSGIFPLLVSSESDFWKDFPPARRDSLLARFSFALERLLMALDAEEWGISTDETKLQRAQFYAEVAKLKPLFDSWRSALCKQSEAALSTDELVERRESRAKRMAEDEKEIVDKSSPRPPPG